MERVSKFIAAAILLTWVAGCWNVREGTHPGVRVESGSHWTTGVVWNGAAIIDDFMAKRIAVEATNSRRTETGTLEVWATLRNRTDYSQQVECRVQFFDKDKVPIEGPSAWQRIVLSANAISTYKESSLKTTEIAYYYIEIREGR